MIRIIRLLASARWIGPILCAGLLFAQQRASAQPEDTLPVERLRPGQTGYGLTVFDGFKVERFDVRVIDVLDNFLPKQDLIIMQGDHPVLRRAGVLGGMSGSPIYIEGKLVGALAYGWRFSKEPVFGVTPIKHMFELLKRPERGPGEGNAERVAAGAHEDAPVRGRSERDRERLRAQLARFALNERWRAERWWRPLPRRARPGDEASTFVPLAVPLNAAGVGQETMPVLREAFKQFGFEPLRGGGTGRAEGPEHFSKGGAIGVQMARGDISLSGTGTVTWTDGKRVLGFGHPMFNAGEIYLPVVTAKVNHSLASLARSFKLASPGRVLGALVHDRQPGILASTGVRSRMIPMTVALVSGAQRASYKVEIARHPLLTPSLVTTVVTNAVNEALSDVVHMNYGMRTSVALKGYPALVIEEEGHSEGGLRMGALFASRGLNALHLLFDNPFHEPSIERVDVEIRVSYDERPLEIVGARVPSSLVRPGQVVPLQVIFRPFDGPEFSKSYPVRIPAPLGGSIIELDVASGQLVRPDSAPPESFAQLLEHVERHYPARSVVLSLETPTQGLLMRGRVLRDLPESVIDSLRTASTARPERGINTALRQVIPTSRLIVGRQKLRLRVKEEAD